MLIAKIIIKLFGKKVGTDELNNSYYEIGNRRMVYYAKEAEPSAIPPLWHAWLHKSRISAPEGDEKNIPWQIVAHANKSGRVNRYYPKFKDKDLNTRESWIP